MRNIKLEIEYDGTHFAGWEIQPGKRTIRGEIESALGGLLQEPIKLTSASRTDAGVHALCQVANFKTENPLATSKIKNALLGLPRDIYVKNVAPVDLQFNARKDATSRVYLYRLWLGRMPLLRNRVWEYPWPIDIDKIKKALNLFLGIHRFDLFSYRASGECKIKRFELVRPNVAVPITSERKKCVKEFVFKIEANRFLQRMVRMIIGTLTELGRGKIKEYDVKLALELQGKKWLSAPPQGLYLKGVKYRPHPLTNE
ncbi:tRNA pseudouridine(38-40) synthase TruA [candidate division WOR-3 bacterium]|nr:tRNA pseudouridine(38-40) synthase TruA [candidate division WOR-3 bacterium]